MWHEIGDFPRLAENGGRRQLMIIHWALIAFAARFVLKRNLIKSLGRTPTTSTVSLARFYLNPALIMSGHTMLLNKLILMAPQRARFHLQLQFLGEKEFPWGDEEKKWTRDMQWESLTSHKLQSELLGLFSHCNRIDWLAGCTGDAYGKRVEWSWVRLLAILQLTANSSLLREAALESSSRRVKL